MTDGASSAVDPAAPKPDFETLLQLVDRRIETAVRRETWLRDDAEDFAQWVRLRLVEDKDAWLTAYQGRASLATYVTVIVTNLLRDYRNHKLGKWRPSAAARQAGKVGVRLDELLHRDRRSLGEAIEILRRNEAMPVSVAELEALAARLPPHYPRRFQGGDEIEIKAHERADEAVAERERALAAARTERALGDALATVPPEDRLLLKLRFVEGFGVAQIARRLERAQQPLYRHFERLFGVLRQRLEAAGLTREGVADILGRDPSPVALAGARRPRQRSGPRIERHPP